MSIRRTAAKRDKNEGEIVEALKGVGASVTRLSAKGVPDLLVGFRGENFLLETKGKQGKLTDDQLAWMAAWEGSRVSLVRTVDDALKAIGAIS